MSKRATHNFTEADSRIHERLDRASEVLFGGEPGSPNFGALHMEPPVDVYETRTEVVVSLEMAGLRDEQIEVIVEGRMLIVRGSRKALTGPAERAYHLMEIGHGPFQREIHLPSDVNPEELRHVYKDGILRFSLPKGKAARGRQLRIVVS